MPEQAPAPGPEAVEEKIAREVSRIHEASYGTVASSVEVAIHPGFVVVVTDIVLSNAEQTLLETGNLETVTHMREAFQEVIAPSFVAIVEHATGRRVSSVGSRTVLDVPQPWSLEVYLLDGARESL